ncbi:hypothetical protein [Pseudomonas citronellolis]|uniref:hypothetical protein n=1 Tax=Pseudomonas citronellolis TaxID=53408 RepID=UPI0021C0BE48|nr:hypothetical protein [Pseudomonas citronellolis]UXJ50289.1 hypothetical protein N5P21_20100 [Pseudomonas citronellolis]
MVRSYEGMHLESYFNRVLNEFIDGSLIVDCQSIKLIQKATATPEILEAPGSIKFDQENGATLRLVIQSQGPAIERHFDELSRIQEIKPGQLIPDDHYYTLIATSVDGYVWENSSLRVQKNFFNEATVVSCHLDTLVLISSYEDEKEFARYYITDDLKIPENVPRKITESTGGKESSTVALAEASGRLPGLDVSYSRLKGNRLFLLEAISDGSAPFTKKHATRLLDSLRFCTATFVAPVASFTHTNNTTKIRLSTTKPFNKGIIGPPLHAEITPHFYKLMSFFYAYSCNIELDKESNSIIGKLTNLYSLKGVRIDTIALLLCVACEGMAKQEALQGLGGMPANQLPELEKAIDAVLKSEAVDDIKKRAKDMLSGMKGSRVADKFHILSNVGALEDEGIKAWKDLRNPAAHGSLEFKPEEFQATLDKIHKVLQMIYKLAFLEIDYQGPYTDYGAPGFPIKQYDAPAFKARL